MQHVVNLSDVKSYFKASGKKLNTISDDKTRRVSTLVTRSDFALCTLTSPALYLCTAFYDWLWLVKVIGAVHLCYHTHTSRLPVDKQACDITSFMCSCLE